MKIAIPHWQGRVSPVFDVAQSVLIADVEENCVQSRQEVELSADEPRTRAALLASAGAKVLICGAISRPMEMAVRVLGIEVIAQMCGEVECVLGAFVEGSLHQPLFLMPGCRGRGRAFPRRYRGGRGWRNAMKGGD